MQTEGFFDSGIWGYIISAASGGGITQLVNWRMNKKKGNVEIKQSEIEVIAETVRSVYEPIIKQQNDRIEEINKEFKQFRQEKEEELRQIRKEKQEMQAEYERRIKSLQDQIVTISRSLGIRANNQIRDAETGRFRKNLKEQPNK